MVKQDTIQLKLTHLSKLHKEILHITQELCITHIPCRSNLFQIFSHATLSKGIHDSIQDLTDSP